MSGLQEYGTTLLERTQATELNRLRAENAELVKELKELKDKYVQEITPNFTERKRAEKYLSERGFVSEKVSFDAQTSQGYREVSAYEMYSGAVMKVIGELLTKNEQLEAALLDLPSHFNFPRYEDFSNQHIKWLEKHKDLLQSIRGEK